jgi:hypothetical protein
MNNLNKNKDKIKLKLNILHYSSLFFTTNAITAFLNKYYLYSFLFCILTTTSLIVHSKDNIYTNSVDKIAVLSIVFYGAYMIYNKININSFIYCLVIIITFLFCIYFYIYGFFVKKYCFCNEKSISEKYHFVLHFISSIGHHFIIYMK